MAAMVEAGLFGIGPAAPADNNLGDTRRHGPQLKCEAVGGCTNTNPAI
jgi:hypothetical protein